MEALPVFTEDVIRQNTTAKVFERGLEYFRSGAVVALARRGGALEADVEGSDVEPYRVRVNFTKNAVGPADCTCEYEWGGWCKHIVAVLLHAHNEPDAVEERPELAALLGPLDAAQLRTLVLKLIEREPKLSDTVEAQIRLMQTAAHQDGKGGGAAAPPAAGLIDPTPFRRTMRAIMRASDRYEYGAIGAAVRGVSQVLEQEWNLIRAGDGRNALVVLDVITEEYASSWYEMDDSDGEGGGFFQELGEAWPEALLTAGLTQAERQTWADKLTKWQDEAEEYGIDSPFDVAIAAANEGWDDPAVAATLRGGPLPAGVAALERDWVHRPLNAARLNVLERQGRLAECLRLAEAAGLDEQYLRMLVRLGRSNEATEQGLLRITDAGGALALAQALQENGQTERALRIAEHGLTLPRDRQRDDREYVPAWTDLHIGERRAELALWLRDIAAEAGHPDLALRAALAAFEEELDLPTYLRVRDLAGDAWPGHRSGMLELLRQKRSYYPRGHIDIFLHEGLIDDAIAAVDQGASHDLVEQVVDAAMTDRPEWVIKACRAQAEPIMDGGKAQYYDAAARWEAKAKRAYLALGREAEWREYLNTLLHEHARKYKLRPMLEALR